MIVAIELVTKMSIGVTTNPHKYKRYYFYVNMI